MAELDTLVEKAINDPELAQRLLAEPEATLRSIGIEPTSEMIDAIKACDAESLKQLAAAFGDKRKAAVG